MSPLRELSGQVDYRQQAEQQEAQVNQEVREEAVALLLMALRGARERVGLMVRMGARELMGRRGRVVQLKVAVCREEQVERMVVEGLQIHRAARGRVGQVVFQVAQECHLMRGRAV